MIQHRVTRTKRLAEKAVFAAVTTLYMKLYNCTIVSAMLMPCGLTTDRSMTTSARMAAAGAASAPDTGRCSAHSNRCIDKSHCKAASLAAITRKAKSPNSTEHRGRCSLLQESKKSCRHMKELKVSFCFLPDMQCTIEASVGLRVAEFLKCQVSDVVSWICI